MANIVGTAGSDVLTGTSTIDTIDGLTGNDQLLGGAGNDILDGGDDDDVLTGGTGADSQQGGNGNDLFLIASSAEFAAGESIDGAADTDTLRYTGAAGTLTLTSLVTNLEQVQIASAAGIITGTTAVNINAAAVGNALIMTGNNGANVLTGTAFDDTLTGNAGNDILNGGAGVDQLHGGDGNDQLNGGAGDDQLIGGDGNDTYVVDSVLDTITETLTGGVDLVQSVIDFTLGVGTNLEQLTLIGTDNIDGTGNALNNSLVGNSGNNALSGGDGADQLIGNAGNDVLDGGVGIDQMAGGLGNDNYVVDAASDVVIEGRNAGADIVSASVNHTLGTNVENLTLAGGDLNGTGNTGNNVITGTNGLNILSGLAGNDILDGGDGNDQLLGGDGNDTLDGGVGQDSVLGGLGDDRIVMLVTAGDVDVADGQAGNDTLALSGVVGGTGLVIVDLSDADQVSDIDGAAETLLQNNFEHLDASGLGVGSSVDVTGSAGHNSLIGSDGNDTLDGGNGNDTLNGGAGDDTIIGGAGNDIYVVDSALDTVTEMLAGATGGVDLVQSTAATFTVGANVERLTLMGAGNIEGIGNTGNNILTGNSGNNILTGDAGNDILTGNAGDDTLDGGAGADAMAGGLGDDIYVIDSASDRVTEASNAGMDLVQATVSRTLGAHVEHLTLLGGGHLNGTGNTLNNDLTGNSGNNILTGLAGADTLIGDDGNDTLDGGTGIDDMAGGLGDDLFVVDTAADSVSEAVGEGSDTVRILYSVAATTTIDLTSAYGGEVEHVVVIGSGLFNLTGNIAANNLTGNAANNTLSGGAGDDVLSGNAGNDTLDGGDDDDVLNGGTGADSMTGGLGNDTYMIDNLGDTITELAGQGTDQVQANRT
ncbi:MAG: hypothetical protein HP490_06900, partial [Nitrospira sp.]|nr:hypothetical protein [Nitrospira sp.]